MQAQHLSRFAATLSIEAVLLTACGGSQPPIGAPSAMRQSRAIAQHAVRGKSWMLPEAKNSDLLYAASEPNDVYVFSYPRGKLVGTLTGIPTPMGTCVDNAGDLWITDYGTGNIVEYEHGGSAPISTLNANVSGALGCSVDPTTGNLAVSYQNGFVATWAGAQGQPNVYDLPYQLGYCGYDNAGNLFVNSTAFGIALLELPAGNGSFYVVSLDKEISPYAGQVQWDGKYITLESKGRAELHRPGAIYRIAVSGYTGKIVGTTTFSGLTRMLGASWMRDGSVIVPYGTKRNKLNRIGVWKYPDGGNVTHIFGHIPDGGHVFFRAVSVSLAPHP